MISRSIYNKSNEQVMIYDDHRRRNHFTLVVMLLDETGVLRFAAGVLSVCETAAARWTFDAARLPSLELNFPLAGRGVLFFATNF